MSDIDSQVRARLKQLRYTAGYGWWWDEDQWALLLSDLNDTDSADEAGYVAIVPTEYRRWAIRFVIDELASDDLFFVRDTLEEAKRHVDMLLASDTLTFRSLAMLIRNDQTSDQCRSSRKQSGQGTR
jgi:hypothetical protein